MIKEKIEMVDVVGGGTLVLPMVEFLKEIAITNTNGYILLNETRELWKAIGITVKFVSPDSGKYLNVCDILGNRKPNSKTFERLFKLYKVEIIK